MTPAKKTIRFAGGLLAVWSLAMAPQDARAVDRAAAPIRLPFLTYGGEVVVPVSIEGSRPLDCILDTGMTPGVLLMDPATGAELGLEYDRRVRVGGAGEGEVRLADVAAGIGFEIAGARFGDQRAIVLTELPAFMDRRFDGIVGTTVFEAFVVEIDFVSRVLVLHDPAGFDTTGAGTAVPLDFSYTKPFVNATVRIGNSPDIAVSLVVDLGAGHALALNRDERPPLPAPDRTIPDLLGTGLRGDVFGRQGRIRSLRVGPFRFDGVVTSFPDNTDEAGLGPYARNGNLGLGVLRRFTVTFDYARSRMFLRPNEDYARPFEANMAGLALRNLDEAGVDVYWVRPYSPAFKAGIEKGDTVVSVNGRPAGEWDDLALEALLERAGESVELSLRRGERRFSVTLVLERPI